MEKSTFSHLVRGQLLAMSAIWLIHITFYLFSPFEFASGKNLAELYSWSFVAAVFFIVWLLRSAIPTGAFSSFAVLDIDRWRLPFGLVGAGLTLVGLACHIFDKVWLRGYHYTWCGLGGVREQWLANTTRMLPSSIFSAIGHLLIYFAIPTFFLTGQGLHRRERRRLFVLQTMALVGFLVYAGTIGSRSSVMLFFVCVVGASVLQLATSRLRFASLGTWARPMVLSLVLVVYSGTLWVNRMHCGNQSADSYVTDNAVGLTMNWVGHARPARRGEGFIGLLDSWLTNAHAFLAIRDKPRGPIEKKAYNLFSMFVMYAVTGMGNFEHAISVGERRVGKVTFDFWGAWLAKLGLVSQKPSSERSYGKGFVVLPGTYWYDWGFVGIFSGALLHGLLILFTSALSCMGGFMGIMGCWAYLILLTITLFSPLVFAPSLMSFPFAAFAMATYWGACYLVDRLKFLSGVQSSMTYVNA